MQQDLEKEMQDLDECKGEIKETLESIKTNDSILFIKKEDVECNKESHKTVKIKALVYANDEDIYEIITSTLEKYSHLIPLVLAYLLDEEDADNSPTKH